MIALFGRKSLICLNLSWERSAGRGDPHFSIQFRSGAKSGSNTRLKSEAACPLLMQWTAPTRRHRNVRVWLQAAVLHSADPRPLSGGKQTCRVDGVPAPDYDDDPDQPQLVCPHAGCGYRLGQGKASPNITKPVTGEPGWVVPVR
jgi:hypothetical protein